MQHLLHDIFMNWSCDGLKFGKLIYSSQTKTNQLITLRCVHQRCDKLSVPIINTSCSELVHDWLVLPNLSVCKKKLYFFFIIFPTLDAFFSTTTKSTECRILTSGLPPHSSDTIQISQHGMRID